MIELRRFLAWAICFLALTNFIPLASAATIPPDIKKVVTFILLSDVQGNLQRDARTNAPVANGTGFFAAVKDEPTGSGIYGYLVTAKHVLQTPQGTFFNRIYLRLNKNSGDVEYIPLDLTQSGMKNVFIHPDPTVDIAVVPVIPRQDVFDFKVLPEEMLTTQESFPKLQIGEGSDVFFAGLLVQFYGEHRNFPVVRFGRVAMLPDERIPW